MRILRAHFWAITWAVVMLILMLRPAKEMNIPSVFEGFDKMAHCGFFFVLTSLLYWGSVERRRRAGNKLLTCVKVVICTVLFAFMTEAAQYYFASSRAAEWWDIFADAVGIGMSSFAFLLFYKKRV